MPFLSCSTNTAQQAALAAAQATQDAAIAALQAGSGTTAASQATQDAAIAALQAGSGTTAASQATQDAAIAALQAGSSATAAAQATQDAAIAALQAGGGTTPTAVASAVNAMTAAQLAAMCAKLNCQPTTAALTAALLGLSGSGVAGSMLTIIGGVPVWQAPVAPVAVPDSTDIIKGKVALNLGTAAGDAANSTDALTAAGFVAMLNGTAPNASPNALQAAVGSNPSQYATAAQIAAVGAGAPTAAPTAANPATVHTNTNDEVFRWNGSSWGLSENGFSVGSVAAALSSTTTNGGIVVAVAFTAPRSGRVIVDFALVSILQIAGTAGAANCYAFSNTFLRGLPQNTTDFNYADAGALSAAYVATVTAGQVLNFGAFGNGSNSQVPNGIPATGVAGYNFTTQARITYIS